MSEQKQSFKRLVLALIMTAFLAVFGAPGTSLASPQLDLLGATDSTTPFSASVFGGSRSAIFHNPSLLLSMPSGTSVGIIGVQQALSIKLYDRPDGVDITESIFDAREILEDGTTAPPTLRPLPTNALRKQRGNHDPASFHPVIAIGTSTRLLDDKIALGLYALLPIEAMEAQAPFFSDEREQYFSNSLHYTLLGDRLSGSSMSFAAAGQILPSLAVGAGVTMNTDSSAVSDVFIGDASYQAGAMIVPRIEVQTTWAPHLGLTFDPESPLKLSAAVHFKNQGNVEAKSQVQFWNYPYKDGASSIDQEVALGYKMLPLRVQLGLAWEQEKDKATGWGAALTTTWTQWSSYVNRYGESPALPWNDTFTINAGGQFISEGHEFGFDLKYRPSPVPDQDGRSNYVDNDRIATALGWELELPMKSSIGLQLQLHYLIPRETHKSADSADPVVDEFPDSVDIKSDSPIPDSEGLQTNNPGYPGYESSGFITVGSLFYKLHF